MRLKNILFLLSFFFFAQQSFATIYYSTVALGSDNDVSDVNNWSDTYQELPAAFGGMGNSPVDFTNPADEFHIVDGDAMDAAASWNLAGKLVIESTSEFDASGFNHPIKVDIQSQGSYHITSVYTALVFGTIATDADFYVESNFIGIDLTRTYPNLHLAGTGTISALSATLNVNGDLSIEGKTVNVSTTIARTVNVGGSLQILSGTFRFSNGTASSTINITGDINLSGGTLVGTTSTGSPTVNVTGSFNQSGGIFQGVTTTATATGGNPIFNVGGDFNKTGGTYSARAITSTTGTGFPSFVMSGSGHTITMNAFSNAEHKFTINSTIGLASDFTMKNTLTIGASGNFSINAHTLTISKDISNSGTLSGGSTSNMIFNSSTTASTLPAITLATLTISTSNSKTITMGGAVTVTTLSITSGGIFSIGANTLTLNGTISNSGTFTGGSSSNIIVGATASGLSLPSVTLNNLAVNAATTTTTVNGNVTVNGTLTLTTGPLDNASPNILTLGTGATIIVGTGSLTAAPTFGTSVNVSYTGLGGLTTTYELPSSTTVLNNLTIAKTGAVTLASNITVNGTLTISTGSLNSGGFTIDCKGNWINNATYTANSNTVSFSGTGAQSISGTTTPSFYALTVNKSSGTLTLSNAIAATNTLTLTAGTLDNSSSNITLSAGANISVAAGVLQAAPTFGTTVNVSYTGTGSYTANNTLPTSSTVLNNVTFAKTGAVTLGHAITVNGTLTISSGSLNSDATSNYAVILKGDMVNNGTYVPNSNTTTFSGSTTQTISGSTTTFNNLVVNKTGSLVLGAAITTNGTVSLTAGTIDNSSSQITLANGATIIKDAGVFNTTPTFGTTVNLQYTGSGSLTVGNEMPTSATVLNNVTFGKSGAITLSNAMTVNGILTISSGSLNTDATSNYAVTAKGNWVNNATYTPNSNTTTFSGTTTLSGSGTQAFNHVVVTGSLTLPSAATISGNFTNSGTFDATTNSSTVTLDKSSSSQTLAGNATFYNLTKSNAGTVTITSGAGNTVTINNLIQVNSGGGMITTNGNLVLQSTSSSTAQLLDLASTAGSGGSFSGSVQVKRAIPSGRTGTPGPNGLIVYQSTPVANTTSDYQSDNKNFYFYTTATKTWTKATNGQALTAGVGFSRRIPVAGATYTQIGTVNNGSVSPSLTNAGDGFNLIGNPYPSAIDWSLVTKSNINGNAYYLYNGATYNTFTSGTIAPGQGFMVSAGSGASITFTNAARTSSPSTVITRLDDEPYASIKLNLTGNSLKDESYIRLQDGITDGYDASIDATKLFGIAEAPRLSIMKGDNDLVIYNAAYPSPTKEIPLSVGFGKAGDYVLSVTSLEGIPSNLEVYLKDEQTNTLVNATKGETIQVHTDTLASFGARFSVVLTEGVVTGLSDDKALMNESVLIVPSLQSVKVSSQNNGNISRVTISSLMGTVLAEANNLDSKEIVLPLKGEETTYIVRVSVGADVITKKFIVNR